MIITTASDKGGVGKSTLSFHLAAAIAEAERAKVLLIDGDPNRSVLNWAERAATKNLPFTVVGEKQASKWFQRGNTAEHVVIDTQARPSDEDLRDLLEDTDLLLVPTTAQALSLEVLPRFLSRLATLGSDIPYTFCLTIVDSRTKDEQEARGFLRQHDQPVLSGYMRAFSAYAKASAQGVLVRDARVDSGRKDSNAGIAWADCKAIAKEILEGMK
ncbi:ParA family protein [Sphaerothrix gracilis]|uniref:ParA family protein n=1 Tax=Sphaerothrix gracilis TaxID=3151835 RepID=UPI0031FE39C0